MKTKRLDVPTASIWTHVPEGQLRADASYNPKKDTVEVPAFIVDRVEFRKAIDAFSAALRAAAEPPALSLAALINRISARLRRR